MSQDNPRKTRSPVLPPWLELTVKVGGVLLGIGGLYVVGLLYYGIHPQAMDIGYEPEQPVPYSHAVHVGELGLDCRYCHNTVEESAFASVPPTSTCMNCHNAIWPESEKLAPVRDSYSTGMPVEWVRVHDLPDFVYFDHSAHVTRGVGCVECHGRVDKMEVVSWDKPLSMAWCLSCHRAPEAHLRPPSEVTNMEWTAPEDPEVFGAKLAAERGIEPPTDCSTCHR